MSLHHLLCGAIGARRLLMFAYGDRVRVVEPHLYGQSAAGHGVLSAWLLAGYSRSTPDGGWRTFRLDGMRDVQALDETFARPRPGYHPSGLSLPTVWCALPELVLASHAAPLADAPEVDAPESTARDARDARDAGDASRPDVPLNPS